MIDRAAVEKAIANVLHQAWSNDLVLVVKAAQAHLDTLPKTKMVEVWHVEWVEKLHLDDGWKPRLVGPFQNKCMADGCAGDLVANKQNACVRVTGPHLQEVPST